MNTAHRASPDSLDTMVALAAADGSARHPHVRSLCAKPVTRDLADAVHALCAIHGSHAGMADCALAHGCQPETRDWLETVADAFAAERAYLAQLIAAAGPLPPTPGQAESAAAFVSQRHTLDALARSERRGCSTGGVIALVLDWPAIRQVLDIAAARFGIASPASLLPDEATTAAAVAAGSQSTGAARAIGFGAQQLLVQHRGLWDLLEARAGARIH